MNYRPKSGVIILAQSAVAVSVGATTDETVLATITVPAGAMGPNGTLRVSTAWTLTNGANDKTMRVRLGGIAGTAFMSTLQTTIASYRGFLGICNRGAENSQIGDGPASAATGSGTGSCITGTIDTAAAQTIVITGQKETAGDTLTLERYLVELIPG